MTIGQAGPADLARAITGAARTAGATTPAVRGADWRLGIVTAVNVSAGTVDIGQIRARRMESYQAPAVGDQIVITQNSAGNWLAWGRTNSGTDTPWTQVSLASGYTHNGNSQGNVRYRIITIGGTPFMQWRGGLNITYPTSGFWLGTALPSAARPADLRTVSAACSGASSQQNSMKIDFFPNGTAQIVGFTTGGTNNPPWVALTGVEYALTL